MKGKLYTEARAQGDVLNVVKNSTNIKQTSDKLELTATAVYSQKDLKVRYIRDWINGSSANTSNHWVQITAFKNDVNLALGKTVTGSSVANASWPYTNITDGNFNSGKYGQSNVAGLQWVQVDLGTIVTDLEYIQVFHYYFDGRTYNNPKTEVSADGVTWYPIYDSVIGGTYPETADGRRYYVNDGSFLNRAESKITQTSNKISLVVSDTNSVKGDALVSAINITNNDIMIAAEKVNIKGKVSFEYLDSAMQKANATGDSRVLNPNGTFLDWSSTYPAGWQAGSTAVPTKVVSDNNTGFAAQYSIASTQTAAWIVQDISNTPLYDYVTVEVTFKIVSGTLDGSGVLFRQMGTGGNTIQDYHINFKQIVGTPVLGKWYTITKILKRTVSTDFGKYRIHMMGAWTSFGTPTEKVIQYDSIKAYPSSEAEYKAFESEALTTTWKMPNKTTIDGGTIETNTISVNALKAGTIDATKINVTNINASNITSGSFNASLITTGTLNADRITANTITANKLNIGAANLVNDPMLEAIGTTPFDATTAMANNGWSKGSAVPTFVDDSTYGRVMKLTNVGAANSTIFTNSFYVDSTKAYKVTLRFKYSKSDGTAPTGSMYFGFNGYNSVTSPSNEIANTGSYEYLSDGYSTSGTNPYFFITGKGQSGANVWQTVEVFLYPPEYYGDRMKLKNPTFPGYGTSKKVWFMGYKTNVMKLRLLNYNQSTSYGDGTSTNDLYVSSIQVTEVDAGTLTATNIVTGSMNADLITTGTLNANIIKAGTLNADLVSISSGASGVTINSGGVTASNGTTGVSVKMNSSSGFEIKKGNDIVFTVNNDGTLRAKNITVDGGTISGSGLQSVLPTDAQGYSKYVYVEPTRLRVGKQKIVSSPEYRHFVGTTIDENSITSSNFLYDGYSTSTSGSTLAQNYLKLESGYSFPGGSFSGDIVIDAGGADSMNNQLVARVETSSNSLSVKSQFYLDLTSVGRDVNINALNGSIGENMMYGNILKKTLASVSSQNEVQMDLLPSDGNSLVESTGMRVFSRVNGMGLFSMGSKNNYTFLKFTPTRGTSKKLLELLSEDVSIYSDNSFKTDIKNTLDIGVRSASGSNTLTTVLFADGTKDTGGVWVELGGGSRTHVFAGEKVINPNSDLGFGNTSESILLEANSNFYAYWGTQSGFVDNQGVVGIGGSFRPAVSGRLTLGNDTFRWSTIYAVNPLNTSDSSTKTNIVQLNDTKVHNPRFSYSRWEEKDEISPQIIYQEMKQMPLFLFEYKDIEGASPQVGFMADQLLQDDKTGVASRFVNKETEDSIASASTQSYAATLHVALQEEMKRNDALEKKVEDLEERLLRLEQLLGGQS